MRTEIERELLLRRRRARVPWVYIVYHRHAPEAARDGPEDPQQEIVETLAVVPFLRLDVADWQVRVTY